MNECVLVVDIGTSKVHTNLMDLKEGKTLLSKTVPFNWYHPKEGWSEIDVLSEWEAAQNAVEAMMIDSRNKYEIIALAFSQIGSGLLLLDKDGNPVGNMILAMDGRAIQEGRQIFEGIGGKNDAYMIYGYGDYGGMIPTAKVLWLKKNRPKDFEKAVIIGNIQQFFNWKLGFEPITDRTIASGGGFFDTENETWDETLCNFIGFPVEKLGREPLQADTVLGKIKKFGRVDLGKEVPVILGTHDCSSGLIGLGCIPGSDAVLGNVTGTYDHIGCLLNDFETAKKASPLLICGPIKDSYAVLGATVSGPNLDWFIKTFYPDEGLAAINRLFDLNPLDGLNKVFLTKDINSGDGTIRGINLTTTSGDLFKCIIEGLTFPLVSTVKGFEQQNGRKYGCLRIGGGSAKSDKWSQLRADIFDIRVEKVANIEISSMGAVILAAVALGLYPDYPSAMKSLISVAKVFEPNHEITKRYEERYLEYLERQK